MPEIRTPETVKAYPVGRYTDPNFPEEMHERHTLYRREQSADWNYHPVAAPGASARARRSRLRSLAVLLRENERRANQCPAESLRRGAA